MFNLNLSKSLFFWGFANFRYEGTRHISSRLHRTYTHLLDNHRDHQSPPVYILFIRTTPGHEQPGNYESLQIVTNCLHYNDLQRRIRRDRGAAMRRDEGREELSRRVKETCKWIYITFMTATVIVCTVVIWIRRVSQRRGGERKGGERTAGREQRRVRPTLFHFTVDPVASFRSLELDLIKIRAGEALTPPIKSSNHSCLPASPSPLSENRYSVRERYPPSIGRGGRVYKGGTFCADLTDLPQINRTPVSRRLR